jgi:predicted MPP superfamily phosphohydrolase
MGKTHLIIPDPHAHPDFNNDRAVWLGELIKDLKPDVVVNLGDMWDHSFYELLRQG